MNHQQTQQSKTVVHESSIFGLLTPTY